jgi:hypothetical protein
VPLQVIMPPNSLAWLHFHIYSIIFNFLNIVKRLQYLFVMQGVSKRNFFHHLSPLNTWYMFDPTLLKLPQLILKSALFLSPAMWLQHVIIIPAKQLAPWNIVAEVVKKLPAFYGSQRFITMFTRDCNWSISWARWIQYTYSLLL